MALQPTPPTAPVPGLVPPRQTGSGSSPSNPSTSSASSASSSYLISPSLPYVIPPVRHLKDHTALQLDASLPVPTFLQAILATHSAPPAPVAPPAAAALYTLPPAPLPPPEELIPPENFSLVCSGVYRSGFPKKRNFAFMEGLKLKTVLTLVLEDYPDANLKWCQDSGVKFMQFGIPGNKEPFDNIPEDIIGSALVAILDKRNHPLLIHCNKGKHRTGCLVGCVRRTQTWSLTSIFDEYRRFSSPKSRAVDQQFIDLFDLDPVWEQVLTSPDGVENLPDWGMLALPRLPGIKRNDRSDRSLLAGL